MTAQLTSVRTLMAYLLDQRVKEGELDVVFREETQSFGYLQRDRTAELIELAPEPSWAPTAYRR